MKALQIIIGIILLLPGLCSLGFMVIMIPGMTVDAAGLWLLWLVGFGISAIGVWLIRKALGK